MVERTKGLIEIVDDRNLYIGGIEGILVAHATDTEEGLGGDCPAADSNAERLRGCWNACEGIADPSAIPELLAVLRAFVDYYERHGGENCLATPTMEYRAAKLVLAKIERDDKTM